MKSNDDSLKIPNELTDKFTQFNFHSSSGVL